MTPSSSAPSPQRITWADVVDIESMGTEAGGRVLYAWVRCADGRGAIWEIDFREPLGLQHLVVIEGA